MYWALVKKTHSYARSLGQELLGEARCEKFHPHPEHSSCP